MYIDLMGPKDEDALREARALELEQKKLAEKEARDEVEEAEKESFPASDPSPWTLGIQPQPPRPKPGP